MKPTIENKYEILDAYKMENSVDGVNLFEDSVKGQIKNAQPIDGALLCNYYLDCIGFSYNRNRDGGTITLKKKGGLPRYVSGETFYRKKLGNTYIQKYAKKWPHCSNVKCLNGSINTFESECNKYDDCTGFSFTSNSSTGGGCLKRCGTKEFGGYGYNSHGYWAKPPNNSIEAHIGSGNGLKSKFGGKYKESSTIVDPNKYICPKTIDKTNWSGCHPNCHNQYPDRFNIIQSGNKVFAQRLDSYNNGWGMNLKFKCHLATSSSNSWREYSSSNKNTCHGGKNISVSSKEDCLNKLKEKASSMTDKNLFGTYLHVNNGQHRICRYGTGNTPSAAAKNCNGERHWTSCAQSNINCSNINMPKIVSGITKVRYDALKRDYDTMQEQYDFSDKRLKDFKLDETKNPIGITETDFNKYRKEILEGFVSNTITRPNEANTQFKDINVNNNTTINETELKSQRTRLSALRTNEYNNLTKSHQVVVDSLNNTVISLERDKTRLIAAEEDFKGLLIQKRAIIAELNENIRIATEDAKAAAAHLTDQLNNIILKIKNLGAEIVAIKTLILEKEALVVKKTEELKQKGINYLNLLRNSRERKLVIEALKLQKEATSRINRGIQSTIDLAPKMLKIHKESLKELEAELAAYMLKPDSDPIILTKLLQRKKALMSELFDEKERKYSENTYRLNRRFVANAPTDILFRNQQNEYSQNNKKIDTLRKDMTSVFKQIHTQQNEYRKSSYFIFILKQIFIYILLILLIGLLMKNKNVPEVIGYGFIAVLTVGIVIIMILNIYFNRNRNRVYFNKRDWAGPSGKVKGKCPLKKNTKKE